MRLTENIAYLAGLIIGDGNLSKSDYLVRIVDENKEFIEIVANLIEKEFNKKPKIYFDKFNNSFVCYIHSKEIWNFFTNELHIPYGNKSRIATVPQEIIGSNEKMKKAFLSGIFDAEGSSYLQKDSHHPNGYPRVQIKMYNSQLISEISMILKEIGISHKTYHYFDFSIISIHGYKNCSKFFDIIGSFHPVKKENLISLLSPKKRGGECRRVARLSGETTKPKRKRLARSSKERGAGYESA
jgi:archaeal flagellar protein FlaI